MAQKKVLKKTIGSAKKKTSAKNKVAVSPSAIVGQKLSAFRLMATDGEVTEKSFKSPTVIYFYPKDNTSGCTQEGLDFKENFLKFKKMGFQIYGVSRDSLKSHEGFRLKQQYPFHLISDPDEVLCGIFDVIKEKSLYGRKYMGVDRSTFLVIDGKVVREWRSVKVPGHVIDVFTVAKEYV